MKDKMIVGDPKVFALESEITEAYDSLGLRALGFFVIYVSGRRFGFKEPDATILATAFDGVCKRLAHRGDHKSSLPLEANAERIAIAFSHDNFPGNMGDAFLYGIPWPRFFEILHINHCVWAPDGEEGFDDGSRVLHFDYLGLVRLIGFHDTGGYQVDAGSLREAWLPAEEFYEILQQWRDRFQTEWLLSNKYSEG